MCWAGFHRILRSECVTMPSGIADRSFCSVDVEVEAAIPAANPAVIFRKSRRGNPVLPGFALED